MLEYIIIGLLIINIILIFIFKGKNSDKLLKDELERIRRENSQSSLEIRQEIERKIDAFDKNTNEKIMQMTNSQIIQLGEVAKNNQNSVQTLTQLVENKLKEIQKENQQKLDNIRQTLDENLNKTLQTRIGESFKTVSERLEMVHKGLGEMQTLAQGVGDLKKVLSNVKTRGVFGEIQLENLLEQTMSYQQYEKQVNISGREQVEFALKIPQGDDGFVWLPIDSKFPLDVYNHLLDAYESSDQNAVILAQKELENAIKKSAKDIRDKYLHPTKTVGFGIMFLPVEGLYAEVVRRNNLMEQIQKMNVLVAGPTTLTALISSLQIGFKTIAIQKRSTEVWKILGEVKGEFLTFEKVLYEAQKRINMANDEIEKLVTTRTKKIISKLKDIEEIEYVEE